MLWARASRGRDVLPEMLEKAGANLQQLVVYRNEDVEGWPAGTIERLATGRLDWIGLSSPSIARGVARLAGLADVTLDSTRLASISPVTSQAAREAGLEVSVEAENYTWDGLLAAIVAAEG